MSYIRNYLFRYSTLRIETYCDMCYISMVSYYYLLNFLYYIDCLMQLILPYFVLLMDLYCYFVMIVFCFVYFIGI